MNISLIENQKIGFQEFQQQHSNVKVDQSFKKTFNIFIMQKQGIINIVFFVTSSIFVCCYKKAYQSKMLNVCVNDMKQWVQMDESIEGFVAFMNTIQVRYKIFDFVNDSPIFLMLNFSCLDMGPINPIFLSAFLCIDMLKLQVNELSTLKFQKEWYNQIKVAFNFLVQFNHFEFMVVFFMIVVSIVLLLAHMLLVAHLIYISFPFSYRILV